jgi:radical SAM superfamily enzyme YgiQ (UPF0313 family)
MRVLLVGPDQEENLSIRYLASSLRAAGHEPALAAFNSADLDDVVRRAEGFDWVGLSLCFQSRAREFLELAERIGRLPGRPRIVVGGHFATCSARELMEHAPAIDVVVLHEGEDAIVALADGVPYVDIPGVWWRGAAGPVETSKRRSREDLDALPFPDRSTCSPACRPRT